MISQGVKSYEIPLDWHNLSRLFACFSLWLKSWMEVLGVAGEWQLVVNAVAVWNFHLLLCILLIVTGTSLPSVSFSWCPHYCRTHSSVVDASFLHCSCRIHFSVVILFFTMSSLLECRCQHVNCSRLMQTLYFFWVPFGWKKKTVTATVLLFFQFLPRQQQWTSCVSWKVI